MQRAKPFSSHRFPEETYGLHFPDDNLCCHLDKVECYFVRFFLIEVETLWVLARCCTNTFFYSEASVQVGRPDAISVGLFHPHQATLQRESPFQSLHGFH